MKKHLTLSQQIAEDIVSVQPISGDTIRNLYEASQSKEALIEQGYTPVSSIGLLWVKK